MSDFTKNINLPTYEEATQQHNGTSYSIDNTKQPPPQTPFAHQQQQSNIGAPSAPPPQQPSPHIPGGAVPMYGAFESTPIHVQMPMPVPPEIIIIGGCPACRIGILEDSYPLLGVCCAIVFFPLGILCCLALKNKRCTNCGMEF